MKSMAMEQAVDGRVPQNTVSTVLFTWKTKVNFSALCNVTCAIQPFLPSDYEAVISSLRMPKMTDLVD